MNEYEKDLMKLFDTHEKADKCELIKRINWEIEMGGIKRYGKNDWVCKVTGSPMGTVCTWFTNAKCRSVNKIPLYALCQIAVALEISVWEFYKIADDVNEVKEAEPKINRRDKLYWHIRRNEAGKLWNDRYGSRGLWTWQSKEVQREFIDKLYLERLAEQQTEESVG